MFAAPAQESLAALARVTTLVAVAFVAVPAEPASGQCMQWDLSPGFNTPTRDLRVLDVGSGPALYSASGNIVRRWTGVSWALAGGEGFDDFVFCLGSYDSGVGPELWAGGQFTETYPSQHPANGLARLYNGTWLGGWLPTVGGGSVHALSVFDDGSGAKLYAGGYLPVHSSLNSNGIVAWNGTSWSGVGGGLTGVPPYPPYVGALCAFDDGTGPALYVGGQFLTAGGITANGIAKWNGANWSPLGSGLSLAAPGSSPYASGIAVFDDGTGPALYVAGGFDHAGGVPANSIAKWDGASWSALPGLSGAPFIGAQAIAIYDDGNGSALYLGLNPSASIGQSGVMGVARWDGQSWSSLGGGFGGPVRALESFDDGQGGGPALWVGGDNSTGLGGTLSSADLARWYGGCTHGIDPMCVGDSTFALCPCQNNGSSLHGCANSLSSQGALLSATGTTNPDTLALQSAEEPTTSLSLFLQSDALFPVPVTFGDGILCLGGQIGRMYVKTASAGVVRAPEPGEPSITQLSAMLGDPIAPGSVRYYQVWYRDANPSFCWPGNFNISNGLRVVW